MLFVMLLGIALWIGAHFFKRMAPDQRAAMGDAGKGVVAVVLLTSVVLMVIGYRGADFRIVYHIPGAGHLSVLMMLAAIPLLGLGSSKSRLFPTMRHPMLTGFAMWCGAHLLANGDSLSVLLFGSLGVWSIWQMGLINQATNWAGPVRKPGSVEGDIRLGVISLVLFVVLSLLHIWLGPNPFTGA